MKHPTPAVIAIIAANVVLFAITYLIPLGQHYQSPVGPGNHIVDALALHYPMSGDLKPWQFVTHMFMHGNAMHILFNMIGVYLFGGPLERLWGAKRFVIFYAIAGLGAAVIYTGVNFVEFTAIFDDLTNRGVPAASIQSMLDTRLADQALRSAASDEQLMKLYSIYNGSMLGASGALYGVLVAFATLFPNVKLALIFFPVPIAAKYFVPIIVLLDLFSGITGFSLFGGGIAHFAHIGGAIIGFAMMLYWKDKHQPYQAYYR